MTYDSSNPAKKVIAKDSNAEDIIIDINLNINLNDNGEERISQHDIQKARTINENPAIKEVAQGILRIKF